MILKHEYAICIGFLSIAQFWGVVFNFVLTVRRVALPLLRIRLPLCFKMSGLYLGIQPDTLKWEKALLRQQMWTKWLSVCESLNLVCLLSKKRGLLFSDWRIHCLSYCSSLVVFRIFHFCLKHVSLHRYILLTTTGTRSPSAFCPRWVNSQVNSSY